MRRHYIVEDHPHDRDSHRAEWAGYTPDGFDHQAHMHAHPDGPYIRHDGKVGFLCMAPTKDGRCTDPTPRYLQALQGHQPEQEQASA